MMNGNRTRPIQLSPSNEEDEHGHRMILFRIGSHELFLSTAQAEQLVRDLPMAIAETRAIDAPTP